MFAKVSKWFRSCHNTLVSVDLLLRQTRKLKMVTTSPSTRTIVETRLGETGRTRYEYKLDNNTVYVRSVHVRWFDAFKYPVESKTVLLARSTNGQ